MADFAVRHATGSDVEAMMAQFAGVVAEERWLGTEPGFDRRARAEGLRGQLAEPATHGVFLAVAGDGAGDGDGHGEVVGQIGVHRHDYGVAELGMAVSAGWRRRGVGRALLDAAVAWARQHDVHKLALQCWAHNEAALALYGRAGFVWEGYLDRHYARRNGELWGAVVMGLVLDR
jgi:RimJ/RimL family protein N-acetyltransferase